jgi:anti-sigma regulatory factor (Ser/Thr protein kinase)
MASSARLKVRADGGGLRAVADALDAFAADNRLPEAAVQAAQVALDELLSNTVRAGYEPGAPAGEIEVGFSVRSSQLEIVITDDARPFNPLERPDPDVAAPLEEKPIGGLGIYLVKKLMDAVEYERVGERNRLRLGKRLGT